MTGKRVCLRAVEPDKSHCLLIFVGMRVRGALCGHPDKCCRAPRIRSQKRHPDKYASGCSLAVREHKTGQFIVGMLFFQ